MNSPVINPRRCTLTLLVRFWHLLADAAREIFDEAAYERFLTRTGRAQSCKSYAEFWRERQAGRPRPRCC
jgi:hypothetical protein